MRIEILGTIFFGLAILHSFFCGWIARKARKFPVSSGVHKFLHLIGEVEAAFGVWAGLFLIIFALSEGPSTAARALSEQSFVEPLFIFVILILSSTRPVLALIQDFLRGLSVFLRRLIKIPAPMIDVFLVLTLGTLAGSFITEPAAMTLSALLLRDLVRKKHHTLIYFLLAVLFVNVSIGGALTPYAAPPLLMVVKKWGWDFSFVFFHFGWRSILAVSLNTLMLLFLFRKAIPETFRSFEDIHSPQNIPRWISFLHLLVMALVVAKSHEPFYFLILFFAFVGFTRWTAFHQSRLRWREGIWVGIFLGSLVVFGGFQKWWLEELLIHLTDQSLYLGAVGLTAIVDNAALTYLGSQVEVLNSISQYALVAGALAGGGLTIIANAPNAIGFSLLGEHFEGAALSPLRLLISALPPTLVAVICLGYPLMF